MNLILPQKDMVVIDLFCGVGGFSLGAVRAGYKLIGAVDVDKHALYAHKKNFPLAQHLDFDLSTISGRDLLKELNVKSGTVCGVIGGPPCQGFSCIGKRLRGDPRSKLFVHYFRLVNEIKPLFYLCENVPGILNASFNEMVIEAHNHVKRDYESIVPFKLKANDYGAPTSRERVFFFGIRKDSSIKSCLKDITRARIQENVTVSMALKGLPKQVFEQNEVGWRKNGATVNGAFGKRLSDMIPDGVGDNESIRLLIHERKVSGCQGTRHTFEVLRRFETIKQGERDKVSKALRLELSGYCPTLRAGTDSSRGSYQAVRPIHPTENRVITPREGARLQGFPDWFQFDKTKWHSFRQIGNSICPILAETVLRNIRDIVEKKGR